MMLQSPGPIKLSVPVAKTIAWGLVLVLSWPMLTACVTSAQKDLATSSDETEAKRRARIRLELASAYYARGQIATALDEVKQAIAIDPNVGTAFNLRGLIYAGMGEDRLAVESFDRALQLHPSDGSAMHNYGWYLCQRARYNDAQALFSKVLELPRYPDRAQTQLAQGVCLNRSGQFAAAERSLLASYESEPGNPTVASNLAEVLYRRGEYERARFYIRRVNNLHDVSNAESLWLALRIERKLGNRNGVNELSSQLRNRFPRSRESQALDRGQFDD